MKFVNKEHFDAFLNCLSFLGQGSQGICYLDSKNRIVYKVLHEYFDEDENIYFSKDDLLKFSDIKNKTFIWPTDIISVDGKVYGYIMPYKRAKNLNASNPLMVNLNSLEKGILRAEKDIKLLTDNGVHICDLRYNTLYNNGNIYVIDTIEYDYKLSTYKENREGLDKELILYLVIVS